MTPVLLTLLLQAGGKVAGSTVPAWAALVAALVGALATIAAAYITLRATDARETNRLNAEKEREANRLSHERTLKEKEHQRQLEERKERWQAYRNMAIVARTLGVTKRIDPNEPEGRTDLAEALADIQILAHSSEVVGAADSLANACADARKETARAHDQVVTDVEENDQQAGDAIKRARHVQSRFLQTARAELGLPEIAIEEGPTGGPLEGNRRSVSPSRSDCRVQSLTSVSC